MNINLSISSKNLLSIVKSYLQITLLKEAKTSSYPTLKKSEHNFISEWILRKRERNMTQKRGIASYRTFLRRTKANSPTKQVTKRKIFIQPIPGSLGLPRVFPSVSTPACSKPTDTIQTHLKFTPKNDNKKPKAKTKKA